MAFNKKGSLGMSINAIVMLVMAMALLGLGLTFIRGMMGGATGKLGGAIDAADLSEPPTPQNPVTMDRTVKVKQGKSTTLKIGFYNADSEEANDVYPYFPSGACKASSAEEFEPNLVALPQTVPTGESVAYEVILDMNGVNLGSTSVPPGTYACSLDIGDETTPVETKQFFLEITS